MCMGFGCNAAGVVACRIIDSPRERLIAILTNNFVPCNGRFPTLIVLATIFLGGPRGFSGSLAATVVILGVIVLGAVSYTHLDVYKRQKSHHVFNKAVDRQ